ncbi:hypothetical protein F4803DRAFT_539284 [Xylaria telfairii]|nr:hypothetical protein F4803DRAFT_539284 [Xylaria telfairii]
MTVLEIALPNLKKDPVLIREGMKGLIPSLVTNLKKSGLLNGMQGFFATEDGRDISDECKEVLLLEWPTTQHFQDFIASPGFLAFAGEVKEKYAVGPPELKLFEVGSEVSSLFGSETILEYIIVKVKDDSEAGVQSVLQKLQSGLSQLGTSKVAVRKSSNLPTQEIAIVSLYASDAELETAKASTARQQLLADVANAADLTSLVAHVKNVRTLTEE